MLTLHWPLVPVVQEAVPVIPLLQEPLTVAFATGLWLTSCTVMVTLAVHLPLWLLFVPSKSPICMVVGVGVEVRVCVGVGVRVAVDPGGFVAVNTGVGVVGGGVDAPSAGPM